MHFLKKIKDKISKIYFKIIALKVILKWFLFYGFVVKII